MNKKILILFETSGSVSIPFLENGFDVTTIDILPHRVNKKNHIFIFFTNIR